VTSDEEPFSFGERAGLPGEEAVVSGEQAVSSDEAAPPPAPGSRKPVDPARWVAVLIMVVTLLGAVFTFLQTAASNHAAAAARRADAAAVETEGEAVRAAERVSAQWRIWTLFLEESQITVSLAGSGENAVAALAQGSYAAALATASFAGFDLGGQFAEEWQQLFEQTWGSVTRAGEFQKAYAAERSAWGAKRSQYVAVVTVLAVALFLLGLSRTSAAVSSGPLLVWSGLAVAGVASIWGLTVFLGKVAPPSTEAIDAYVEGQVAFGSAFGAEDLERAEEAFTRALGARPDYSDAYFGRGLARSQLDFHRDGGPLGSEAARDDFARVVALDPFNPVAWNNLAVAQFWLGDLDGAIGAIRRAAGIGPDDPLANLNLALLLLVTGDAEGYEAQLSVVRGILGGGEVHDARRAAMVADVLGEADLAEQYRPEYAEAIRRYREDLLRLDHQITVGKQYFGTATPVPVDARISSFTFALSEDRTELQATFDATGVAAGQRWLWRTYRGGVEDAALSYEPEVWPFAVPDYQVAITLTAPEGFAAGVPVRVEVFIEGNLLQAGEYTP
jgi:tetratricopeptide (TPR) repeat protein